MNGRRLGDERPTMSGFDGLASIAPRGEITDNVYESPGVEIGYDREPQDVAERPYDGDVQDEAYSSSSLREVNIRPLSSGYLVNVGCQSVAVETTETLLKTLGEYLNNPTGFERDWNKNPNRSKL